MKFPVTLNFCFKDSKNMKVEEVKLSKVGMKTQGGPMRNQGLRRGRKCVAGGVLRRNRTEQNRTGCWEPALSLPVCEELNSNPWKLPQASTIPVSYLSPVEPLELPGEPRLQPGEVGFEPADGAKHAVTGRRVLFFFKKKPFLTRTRTRSPDK